MQTLPNALMAILPNVIPYAILLIGFAAFIVWNGGIVLGKPFTRRLSDTQLISRRIGDKANHIPAFHVPQLYYFIGFATALGWPVFLSTPMGLPQLMQNVFRSMFGNKRYVVLVRQRLFVLIL